ncbi:DUF2062 domain-containing protein [Gammaproteobacteria bacterium]|nr:DUF2062 domain-containing protein [Gammaproteobacteria bacterium]
MRNHAILSFLGHRLLDPELWHLHRRSVGGAFFGLFCAFLPIPTQMLVAASMAIIGRCNIPLSVGVTWVTNPLTMGPMFFFAYKLGAWLLDTQLTISAVELSWSWLSSQIGQIWRPLLVGWLICGWISGLSGMLVSRILWGLHVVRRWRQRAGRRKNDIAL